MRRTGGVFRMLLVGLVACPLLLFLSPLLPSASSSSPQPLLHPGLAHLQHHFPLAIPNKNPPIIINDEANIASSNDEKQQHYTPKLNPQDNQGKVVLIGVLTVPSKTAIRSVMRSAFRKYPDWVKSQASLFFVMGNPLTPQDAGIIRLESEEFRDILLLPSPENMNKGKTYEFFVAAEAVRPSHAFYLKADDDTFIHVPNLIGTLRRFPASELVYYGRYCKGPKGAFMCGMAYALSASLFALIPRPPFQISGHEDQITDWWVRRHVEPKFNVTRYSEVERFYDWEFATIDSGPWKRPFAPGNRTIVVHQLKDVAAYNQAVAFFTTP